MTKFEENENIGKGNVSIADSKIIKKK